LNRPKVKTARRYWAIRAKRPIIQAGTPDKGTARGNYAIIRLSRAYVPVECACSLLDASCEPAVGPQRAKPRVRRGKLPRQHGGR